MHNYAQVDTFSPIVAHALVRAASRLISTFFWVMGFDTVPCCFQLALCDFRTFMTNEITQLLLAVGVVGASATFNEVKACCVESGNGDRRTNVSSIKKSAGC